MLTIGKQPGARKRGGVVITLAAIVLFGGGLYLLSLITAPVVLPALQVVAPIKPETLSKPNVKDNRIIIPKIGVNIAYGRGQQALDNGAEWRKPDNGNPETGGNFVVAAHRFSLAPTPTETVRKSPFYHIDKLAVGDNIIIDYNGKRYGYRVSDILSVKPDQVEIEQRGDTDKLTLYSCSLGGARDGRIVLIGTPLGEVTVNDESTTKS